MSKSTPLPPREPDAPVARLRHSWKRRPQTRTTTFRLVSLEAKACGLHLNAANNLECAMRIGRYWLNDPSTRTRVMSAMTLVDVLGFLATRRAVHPTIESDPSA